MNGPMDLAFVLTRMWPDAEWALSGDSYEGLVWFDEVQPKPTEAECEAAWPEALAQFAAERAALEDARASGLAKLQALGLTEAEAMALAGG